MINLYLHHRHTTGDAWTVVPSLTSVFTNSPAGTLPVSAIEIESGPQLETPCGCPGSTDDTYLILRVACAPIPLSYEASILTFLMNYKSATYYEAKLSRYGQGGFVTAGLTHIEAKERDGMMHLSFRLAALISDALTNT
jgi:hypothetical protein